MMSLPTKMLRYFTLLLMMYISVADGQEWVERPELRAIFESHHATGTFAVLDPVTRNYLGHDEARARTRYVPASTYKVAHTLIGLNVAAVRDVDELLAYGRQPQPIAAWEHDMSLRDAIAISNVAIYQTLARRIGLTRMQAQLSRLDFGNGEAGTSVDRFWLDGPLAISAIEQVDFFARFADKKLPLSIGIQEAVADIIRQWETKDWGLWAKSGWEHAPRPGIGWWVGWMRKGEANYAFALNIDIQTPADANKRESVALACLRALGLAPVAEKP